MFSFAPTIEHKQQENNVLIAEILHFSGFATYLKSFIRLESEHSPT
jgi:hypothetical protein